MRRTLLLCFPTIMDNPEIFQHLSDCYRHQGHPQQAIAYYHRSLQYHSNHETDSASRHQQWGEWFMSLQEWHQAIEAYERSLSLNLIILTPYISKHPVFFRWAIPQRWLNVTSEVFPYILIFLGIIILYFGSP